MNVWWWSAMMTNAMAFPDEHSQWPPKSFRLRQAWELLQLLSFLRCLSSILVFLLRINLIFSIFTAYYVYYLFYWYRNWFCTVCMWSILSVYVFNPMCANYHNFWSFYNNVVNGDPWIWTRQFTCQFFYYWLCRKF